MTGHAAQEEFSLKGKIIDITFVNSVARLIIPNFIMVEAHSATEWWILTLLECSGVRHRPRYKDFSSFIAHNQLTQGFTPENMCSTVSNCYACYSSRHLDTKSTVSPRIST